jgi:hypothetical protein
VATGNPGEHGDPASIRAGWVLEQLRRLNGWTLVAVAESASITRVTLDAKRRGTSSWTLADTELFASVFDVPAAVFSFDEDSFWTWWSTVGRA